VDSTHTKRKELSFASWLMNIVECCLILPAAILQWFWDWRYPVLWVSSLSSLYFSIIALAYYWHHYPENAFVSTITLLLLLLALWG